MKSIQFTVELRMEAEKKVSKLSAGVVASQNGPNNKVLTFN